MSHHNSGVIVRYVQECVANGRPEVDGYFVFTRKEILQGTEMAASTFSANIDEAIEILANGFDFQMCFHVPDYKYHQENVFVDVSYEKGKLKFKRNPLTLTEEFEYMWSELKPKYPWFCYIYSTTYTDRNK